MNKITLAVVAAMIVSPAVAQSVGEQTGVNSTLGISSTTADFVLQAAVSDMYEIKASELAATKGDDATKTFAAHMIEAHTKTSSQLKTAATSAAPPIDVPAEMDDAHKKMIGKLTSLDGKDFNDEYHDEQVSAHKDAVSLFERYSNGGEDPKLKEWASKTLPDLKSHLAMAQDLDK